MLFFWLNISRWFRLKFNSVNCGICEKTVFLSDDISQLLKSKLTKWSAMRSGKLWIGLLLRIKCSKFTNPFNINGPPIFVIIQLLRFNRFKLLLVKNRRSSFVLKLFNGFPAKLNARRLTAVWSNVFGFMCNQLVMLLFDKSSERNDTGKCTLVGILSMSLLDMSNTSSAVNWSSWFGKVLRRLYDTSSCFTKRWMWWTKPREHAEWEKIKLKNIIFFHFWNFTLGKIDDMNTWMPRKSGYCDSSLFSQLTLNDDETHSHVCGICSGQSILAFDEFINRYVTAKTTKNISTFVANADDISRSFYHYLYIFTAVLVILIRNIMRQCEWKFSLQKTAYKITIFNSNIVKYYCEQSKITKKKFGIIYSQ